MALKFFDDESTGTGSLPFASDYLDENPREHGKAYEVFEVKRTQSDKGYMLYTDKFSCFLFKNQKLAKQLVEALDFYCEKQDGFALIAVLDKSAKNKVKLAVDFDLPRSWFTQGNGVWATKELDLVPVVGQNGNPFLPAVPSTPIETPTLAVVTPSSGKGGEGTGQRRTRAS